MNELTLDGKTYVSSRRAAEITGYAKDYVGQLCREGHVEARLVGRNWYVLESSIREHRFGEKEKPRNPKLSPIGAAMTWDSPRYETEVAVHIAPISEKAAAASEDASPVPETAPRITILSDMQSAWQEWFTKKEDRKKEEEPFEEEMQPLEVALEGEITPEDAQIDLEEPEISQETVEEKEQEPLEAVPIRITSIREDNSEEEFEEESYMPSYSSQEVVDMRDAEVPESEAEEPVGQIRASRKASRARNIVLQSVFIGAALVSVAIAAVGTGFASKFTDFSTYRLSEINLISGVSVYNK